MTKLAMGAAVAVLLAGTGGASAAGAPSPSPYDMTFTLRAAGATPLYGAMAASAKAVGEVPAGATGIVLRWCRKEFSFGAWQFGSRKEQLKLLDDRWCEISYKGKVGNVPGSVLAPE